MRELALNFAAYVQPDLSLDMLQDICDALNGSPESQNCSVTPNNIDPKLLKNRDKVRKPKVIY